MTMTEIESILIATIPLIIGVISHVAASLKTTSENKKIVVQVKKEANTEELKAMIKNIADQQERQAKRYAEIEAENVKLKKQYNRLLSELRGVRANEEAPIEPKHKEI